MFFVVKRNFYGRGIFSAFLLRAALLIMRSFMMFGLICAAERLLGAAAKQQVETGSGGKGYGGKFGVVPRVIRIDGKMVKDKRMEHKYFQIYGFEP